MITILDIETTSLNWKDGHRIIEFASVSFDNGGELLSKYAQRIDPERSIAAAAEQVHGISYSMLVGMPKWNSVAPKIIEIIANSELIIAHNGESFDFPFLQHEIERIGLTMPDTKRFDSMLHARWATCDGKLPSLKELCFACDVDYDISKAHAALYDCEVLGECFFRGLKWKYFNPF